MDIETGQTHWVSVYDDAIGRHGIIRVSSNNVRYAVEA